MSLRWNLIVAVVLVAVYVATYLYLSRRGYEQADQWNCRGFFYFTPQPTDAWRVKHFGCAYLFAPINALDRALGTGRHPGCEPLWGLSR
jgi:hypothetical protein